MKTTRIHKGYVEWLSAEEMHIASKDWLSELLFIQIEHLFLLDLIKSYTLQMIAPEKFSHNKEIIDSINRSQKQNNQLIEIVKTHEGKLKVMVDGIDQPKEEETYKDEHRKLTITISDYLKEYRTLKTQFFNIVKAIKKTEKQYRLLDKL